MKTLNELRHSLLHLLFPAVCEGCGAERSSTGSLLCFRCLYELPETGFEKWPGNPVEKQFYGRLPLQHASARFYFSKDSLVQRLIHEIKYNGNRELAVQLGGLMGDALLRSQRFHADALVPLPLYREREKKRGYNQSALLCEGMAGHLHAPVLDNVIIRPGHTETQTRKGRVERWKNMEGKFILADPASVAGKHILLVDDVITTGATLEACGEELLKGNSTSLSVSVLCYANR